MTDKIRARKATRRAKRALGQKLYKDAQDHFTFMEQCVQDMTTSGEASDVFEAQQICELLWEDEQDLYDGED